MYGIVNKAIKGLLIERFGESTWENVKKDSGVNIDLFLSNQAYDDTITYKLAESAANILELSHSEVLQAFGEYWILKTGMENYGSLMRAGGKDLKEFLVNLPNFHSRVMLMFPELKPPEFRISDINANNLNVHYYSERPSLEDFVIGLLSGLGKMFKTKVEVEHLLSRKSGNDHEVFHVTWE